MNRNKFFLAVCSLLITTASNATVHVPADQPSIQAGINAAAHGDTVIVAPGTYYENLDFKGKRITVMSSDGPETTVIDGSQPAQPERASTVKFVHGETRDTVLEGFTLSGGTGTLYQCTPYHSYMCGGAIFCKGAKPTVRGNRIVDNEAYYGGGIYSVDGKPAILDCLFFSNSADEHGGAGYLDRSHFEVIDCDFIENGCEGVGGGMGMHDCELFMRDTRFIRNRSLFGGGMSHGASCYSDIADCEFIENTTLADGAGIRNGSDTFDMSNCIFIGNDSDDAYGGAISNHYGSPTLTDCVFINNSAGYGGGMYSAHMEASPMLKNCVFMNNTAVFCGGGVCNSDRAPGFFANCSFIRNHADLWGGGMYNSNSAVTVVHCTFYGNSSADWGGGMNNDFGSTPIILNSIFWGDRSGSPPTQVDEIYNVPGSRPYVAYCNVEGGFIGPGNIDEDPMFVDPIDRDCHLSYHSPCRNKGHVAAAVIKKDIDGDPRLEDLKPDMGVDEFHTHIYCTGDFVHGGDVKAKIVGMPRTKPLGLFIGSGVLETPLSLSWGDFYLESPWFAIPIPVPMPESGILVIDSRLPMCPAGPYEIPMQALVGNELTNLFVLEVKTGE